MSDPADKQLPDVLGNTTNSNVFGGGDDGRANRSDLVIATQARALTITIDQAFVVPLILSAGISAALIVFIVKAFEHPAAAAALIPLVGALAPAGAAIVNLIRCEKCRRKEHKASSAAATDGIEH